MSMFYLVFEVRPDAADNVLGGAYVHFWVDQASSEAASAQAVERLRADGWTIVSCSEAIPVSRDDFLHDETALEGFDNASREGDAAQLHGWVFEGDD